VRQAKIRLGLQSEGVMRGSYLQVSEACGAAKRGVAHLSTATRHHYHTMPRQCGWGIALECADASEYDWVYAAARDQLV
jgi:hypothetical protein